ncbi:Microsomal glutathione S-transferase 1 [Pseudolycoriella hygida]|uniref:Microsomal glutathione S-transferase 1 n=1 Tax=Pseudolycoriella hygida TaxID=35572 RepID=A0A9Q0S9M1_9DIPT|nr:Microsomal glutathione S-transferase 1 [Pseudolycoriella hygida]
MSKLFQELFNDNEVFRVYALCTGITVGKILIMSPLTSILRLKNGTFANEEDVKKFSKADKVKFGDESVERVRRAHRNDLENCLPLMTIGFLYVLTEPEPSLAVNVIRAGAAARVIHTIAYLNGWQPLRFLSFLVGGGVTAYMSFKVIMFFK